MSNTVFFPWVRKGLANSISEAEVFGKVEGNDALARMRAALSIRSQYRAYADRSDKEGTSYTKVKEIALYGPADVAGIHENSVSLCHPNKGSEGLPVSYFPYIEFWEPDFPWRYTPAKPSADGRLRPWLALLTFRADQINIQKPENHLPFLSFTGTPEEYGEVFFDIRELSRAAHAQGPESGAPMLSRIISLRGWKEGMAHSDMVDLKEYTDYVVCLVPSFETGRLRGLGIGPEALDQIPAQTAAWDSYEVQKSKTRGMEFPIYYSWSFKTGTLSFEGLVEALTLGQPTKPGVPVDVAHMGNGFDYSVIKPGDARKTIILPAATRAPQQGEVEAPFPAKTGGEAPLYKNLKDLVELNPVFLENAEDIDAEIEGTPLQQLQDDDPWVVPPAYGARHAMATSLDKYEWLEKVNLDVRYRVAAGLGRKAVVDNQEELMDRAWKQVEAVQAFNQVLYQRLLSIGANNSLQGKVVGEYGKDNKYLASLMFYLGAMKDANSRDDAGKDSSITAALAGMDVAAAFATPTFHRMTDQVAKIVEGLDTKTLMENMLEHHTCAFPDPYCEGAYSLAALRKYSDVAYVSIFEYIFQTYVKDHFHKKSISGAAPGSKPGYMMGPQDVYHYRTKIVTSMLYKDSGSYSQMEDVALAAQHGEMISVCAAVSTRHLSPAVMGMKYLPDYMAFDGRTIPSSAIGWYGCFTRYAKERGLVEWGPRLNEEARKLFFDRGFDHHPCAGYFVPSIPQPSYDHDDYMINMTGNSHNVVENVFPNMVVLPHDDYLRYFGEAKPFTRFRLPEGDVYFSDIDYLRERVRVDNLNHISPNDRPVAFFYNLPAAGLVKSLDENCPELRVIIPQKLSVIAVYNGDYVSIGHIDVPKRDYVSSEEKEREDQIDAYYWGKAAEYLKTQPSAVYACSKTFVDEVQTFNTPEDYRDFLLNKEDRYLLPYMSLWKEYNGLLEQLEAKFPPKAPAPAPPKVQPPTMRDDVPYEEAVGEVSDYYSEFFADTLMGAKLRADYVDDLLRSKYPILAYPIFPEPTYFYLKEFSEEMIVPGAAQLPEDSVTLFESDTAFVEAYLAGLNTEMGRELLWREYPTDQRGSYFRKFWDSESSVSSIRKDTFFDITSMHTWTKPLGGNMQKGKESLLIFAIKGRLLRLYPKTRVYLHRAALTDDRQLTYDPAATEENQGIRLPVMETFIAGDTLLLGFSISFATALGNPAKKDYGFILTFAEDVEGLDFLVEEEGSDFREDMDSAQFANTLKNDLSIMGKHLSLFLKK